METAISIRLAEPGDAEAIWPLTRDFATSVSPVRRSFDVAFARLVVDDNALLVVAETSGRAVGYLLASSHETLFANGPVVWVEEVMVADEARRTGVGAALMTAAEDWAATRGAVYVSLATRRADAFYRALQYEESALFFRKMLF
jgi:GNAT superfamily N-acetyltransferase